MRYKHSIAYLHHLMDFISSRNFKLKTWSSRDGKTASSRLRLLNKILETINLLTIAIYAHNFIDYQRARAWNSIRKWLNLMLLGRLGGNPVIKYQWVSLYITRFLPARPAWNQMGSHVHEYYVYTWRARATWSGRRPRAWYAHALYAY